MTAQEILVALWTDGIAPRLAPDGKNLIVPAGKLTAGQRALLLAAKPELIEFLIEVRETTAAVMEAAMKVCDRYGDSPAAREEMRQQVLETPPHLRPNLRDHFLGKHPTLQAGEKTEDHS